jgi:peptidoglycan/LPS O-acetylase OafA/YrhL
VSAPAPTLEDLARGVNRVRFGVLGIVAASGLLLFARPAGEPTPLPATLDAGVTTAVVCLAFGAILLRQVAARRTAEPRTRVRALVATYVCAGAITLCGLATGLATGDRKRGLAYALAGAIFSLGRPLLGEPAARAGRP